MTKRKRKSPEKKKAGSKVLLVLSTGAGALARLAGRHPRAVGGAFCFTLVFGTIAANALWYQPGQHPSPFLRTRDAADFTALAGTPRSPLLSEQDADNVTTFRIEREKPGSETAPSDTTEARPAAAPAQTATSASPAPASLPANAAETAGLIRKVQDELLRRGLYDGEPDGVIGPRTETAIAMFQKTVGMEANGLVTPELLAALTLDRGITAAVPAQRPVMDVEAPGEDPVAAAIRNSEAQVVTAPRRPVTAAQPVPPKTVEPTAPPPVQQANFDPGLVMEIQRGLSNMAYKNIRIDGVPGDDTRAAIRRFERHYQLPETGEPSAAVLKKLKSIGAL
ncbi:peptidoglycan-binding protein [Rhizobium rosettiformans]|uniref:Peptidoglycan-binding protein n=1 Tax=Rhizobium rosettiformans TaxID=1368430 RepID=A0ABX7EWN0_9HYPH|nr:peptidoglycan-binding domain-containing protein [Rhizobium rosettiformans]QRF52355.1 peptidoglycan-binding protein [Rhizobium rosettiformans]